MGHDLIRFLQRLCTSFNLAVCHVEKVRIVTCFVMMFFIGRESTVTGFELSFSASNENLSANIH